MNEKPNVPIVYKPQIEDDLDEIVRVILRTHSPLVISGNVNEILQLFSTQDAVFLFFLSDPEAIALYTRMLVNPDLRDIAAVVILGGVSEFEPFPACLQGLLEQHYYLTRPFGPRDLMDMIERAWKQHQEDKKMMDENTETLSLTQLRAELDAAQRRITDLEVQERRFTELWHIIQNDIYDYRTQHVIIRGYLHLLNKEESGLLGEKAKRHVSAMSSTMEIREKYLTRLIESAYVLSCKEIGLQPLSVEEIINKVWDHKLTNKKQHAKITLSQLPWPLVWGNSLLMEILWDAYLSVCLRNPARPLTLIIGCDTPAANMARFWVQDSTTVLTSTQQNRLFQSHSKYRPGRDSHPYFKDVDGIDNMPLWAAPYIVERWGGEAGVESTAAQGTTLYFTVPSIDEVSPTNFPQYQIPDFF